MFFGMLHYAEGNILALIALIAIGAIIGDALIPIIAVIIVVAIYVAIAAVGINFAWSGLQEMRYALTNGTSPEPDDIPLIHLFFPDYLK